MHVSLEKRLPAGAGIGGGSSDAAAVLRAMTRLYRRPFAGNPVDLGADIPVCLHGRAARMQGIGDIVAPVAIAELPAVLVNPGVAVSTPDVFAALTRRDGPAMADIGRSLARFDDALCWISEQRNDMQDAAVSLQPVIGDVLSALDAAGSRCTRMSGSGATCFGLFASKAGAETAAGHLRDTYPDWWVQAVTLS